MEPTELERIACLEATVATFVESHKALVKNVQEIHDSVIEIKTILAHPTAEHCIQNAQIKKNEDDIADIKTSRSKIEGGRAVLLWIGGLIIGFSALAGGVVNIITAITKMMGH
jgi:hypothetical protein